MIQGEDVGTVNELFKPSPAAGEEVKCRGKQGLTYLKAMGR